MFHFLKKKRSYIRRYNRYKSEAPAFLTFDKNEFSACVAYIHNICCGGALVSSTKPVSVGEACTLHIKVPFEQKWFGRKAIDFIVKGRIIRISNQMNNFAIRFFDDFRMKTSIPP